MKAKGRKATRTLSGARVRYFGKPKELFHLVLDARTREQARDRADGSRRQGYYARVTHEFGGHQVWESHFPRK